MALKLNRLARSGVVACVLFGWAAVVEAQKPAANADALVLTEFQKRIDAYMELHKRLARESPPLKETSQPAEIEAAQEVLAAKLTAARKGAKPGEIFAPETRTLFRRLMYPETKGPQGAEAKETIKEDSPKSVPLKINARYPESAPLPTVPPNFLAALPKLPKELEYRIVNKDLILRDVQANLIVDYIINAIQ